MDGMEMFNHFSTSDYTFSLLAQGSVVGNTVIQEYEARGIINEQTGMVAPANAEAYSSATTLYIKPEEPFIPLADSILIGHGVKIADRYYRVIGQSDGTDYDNNNRLEFYKLTLKRESIATWASSAFPLT